MEYFNDSVQIIATFASILTGFIETIHKRRRYHELCKVVNKLDSVFSSLNVNVERYYSKIIRNFSVDFVVLFSLTVGIELYVILNIQVDPQWVLYWYVNILPLLLSRLRLLQISYFLRIPSIHLRLLEDLIKPFVRVTNKYPRNVKDVKYTEGSNQKLMRFKESYLLILKEMECLNNIFHYSLGAHLLQNFIELLTSSYWLYYYQLNDHCVPGR